MAKDCVSEMVSNHIPNEVTGIPGYSPFRSCKLPMATEVSARTKNRKHFSCVLDLGFNHKSLPSPCVPNHYCSDLGL